MIDNTFPPKMTCTVVSAIRIHPTLPMVSTRPLPPSPAVHLLDVTPLPHELVGADALVAGLWLTGRQVPGLWQGLGDTAHQVSSQNWPDRGEYE